MAVLLVRIAGRQSGSDGPGLTKFFLTTLSLFFSAVTTSSCGLSTQYMGIDLVAEPVTAEQSEIQGLAQRAKAGDKQAQLDLGIRFEEGAGVRRDLEIAKKLYSAAASDSGGRIWVYSPPIGNGTVGKAIPIDSGQIEYGLEEAAKRLQLLSSLEVRNSNAIDLRCQFDRFVVANIKCADSTGRRRSL